MITNLHISQYVLIENLDIDLSSGFSVITGETGAGKSILLGAINLLLGGKADAKMIRNGAQKCVVEASFFVRAEEWCAPFFLTNDIDWDNEYCILRREVTLSGKSRAFINDSPVNLALLREAGTHLVDIHSQHQNFLLTQKHFQLKALDTVASDKQEKDQYIKIYEAFTVCSKKLDNCQSTYNLAQKEEEYVRFQWEQLNAARLKDGEESDLEEELSQLSHAEDIKCALYEVSNLLDGETGGALSSIHASMERMKNISSYKSTFLEAYNRLDSIYIDLKDIAGEADREANNVEDDPNRLEIVNNRLNEIRDLEQRYHVSTVNELISLQKDFEDRLSVIVDGESEIKALEEERDKLLEELQEAGRTLTQMRISAAKEMEKSLTERAISLGIKNAEFSIQLNPLKEPGEDGLDEIKILFRGNKNVDLQELSQVASGGEIARVMLSLKSLVAQKIKCPTIIFDEIDTGVSGRIAEKMAEMMWEMGRTSQVIGITHLPQIAAIGDAHYLVYKEDDEVSTTSRIRLLSQEERVIEISHMLSGERVSASAIENAKALLRR